MRKILSILLLGVLTLPFLSPLLAFGAESDSTLRACCRKDGKHHCAMALADPGPLAQRDHAFNLPPERCPFCPGLTAATHPDAFGTPSAQVVFVSLVSHPAGFAQAESQRRISRDRSRHKRGPPAALVS